MSIYLKNAAYIDWKTLEFKQGHIKVFEGPNRGIEWIPSPDHIPEMPGKGEPNTIIDCKGKWITKSFGCGHHHVYSALARGMPAPKKIPANFHEILQYIWWALDKCLDPQMIEASALATAVACAKHGVTFVIDHHSSPFSIENSLKIIADAFDKIGISHLLCCEMSDRDGETPSQKGLEETGNFLKNGGQGLVGLHASFTVGNDLLQKAVKLAETYNSGIHIHAAEDPIDPDSCLRDHGVRVIQRLHAAGALTFKKTILGHCLHLDENEKELVRNSPVYIAQNTESNLNNNVGVFDSRGFNTDHILLGTDGMHSDMLRSAKAAFLVGQSSGADSPETIYKRFRNVHKYLQENNFTGDSENNLVILDYDSPTDMTPENFYGHFIFGLESLHIESVISKGKLIVRDRKILTIDEQETLDFSKIMAKRLWKCLK